jgi:hypothetical protein
MVASSLIFITLPVVSFDFESSNKKLPASREADPRQIATIYDTEIIIKMTLLPNSSQAVNIAELRSRGFCSASFKTCRKELHDMAVVDLQNNRGELRRRLQMKISDMSRT